jgi:translocation and assembly module TamB
LILPGMRFRASTLLMRFERDDPHFPTLAVAADGRRHGYDVNLLVRGRYDNPEVLLSSIPPLGTDELIVLVTTGQRPATLQSKGAAGVGSLLGAYLAQELADYLFGSDSTEEKESFIERFTLETGTEISANGNESIVVEFRILDRVFLQGERDVYEDINLGVLYRLRFR